MALASPGIGNMTVASPHRGGFSPIFKVPNSYFFIAYKLDYSSRFIVLCVAFSFSGNVLCVFAGVSINGVVSITLGMGD